MADQYNIGGHTYTYEQLPQSMKDQIKRNIQPSYSGSSYTSNSYVSPARQAVRERERRIAAGEKHTTLSLGQGGVESGGKRYRREKEARIEKGNVKIFKQHQEEKRLEKAKTAVWRSENKSWNQYQEQRAVASAKSGMNPVYVPNQPSTFDVPKSQQTSNQQTYQSQPTHQPKQFDVGKELMGIGQDIGNTLSGVAQTISPKYKTYVETVKAEEKQQQDLSTQYDALLTEYNARPKVATSDSEYQKSTQMYNKLNEMYVKLQPKKEDRQLSFTGAILEPILKEIPKYQEKNAGNLGGEIVNIGLGAGKEIISTVASIDNLGTQIFAPVITGERPNYRPTEIPNTSQSILVGNILSGKSASESWKEQEDYAKKYGVGSLIGEYGTLLIGAGKTPLKALPIAGEKLPILTAQGEKNIATFVKVGYKEKSVVLGGKYGEGGFFIGKANPAKSGIINLEGATGKTSFETYELSDYSKFQIKQLTPMVKYAEQKGYVVPGRFEQSLKEASVYKQAQKLNFPINKKFDAPLVETIHKGVQGNPLAKSIAVQQGKKNLERAKGSFIFSTIKGGVKRKPHDFDLTANSEKQAQTAAEAIAKTPANKGYAYAVTGRHNVSIGEKGDPTWSFLPETNMEKGKLVRGTSLDFGKKFIRNPTPKQFPRGELFVTPTPKIAKSFAKKSAIKEGDKPAIVYTELKMSKILQFKNIPKGERKELISDSWQTFQANMKKYAEEKGYQGYTKPYHSPQVNAPKYEVVVWNKEAIKNAELVKPTGYTLKNETDIVNIISPSEEVKSALQSLPRKKTVYGDKPRNFTISQEIDGTKNKIKFQSVQMQITDIQRSTSGITSKRTFEPYRVSEEEKNILMGKIFSGKTNVAFGMPVPARATKDIATGYFWGMRESAKQAWKQGNKPLAREIGLAMKGRYEQEKNWIDWSGTIQKLKTESPKVEVTGIEKPTTKQVISTGFSKTSAGIKTHGPRAMAFSVLPVLSASPSRVFVERRSSRITSSMLSRRTEPSSSVKSNSPKSSSTSTGFSSSPSLKSPSPKSPSPKSPSPKSPSPFSKSPSPKSPSPFSKSPSPKSPSPFSKSPSPKSPSIKPRPPSPTPPSPPSSTPPTFPPSSTPPNPPSTWPTTTPPKKPIIIILDGILRHKTTKHKSNPKNAADFLGNVNESSILGLTGRYDITYGRKRTAKLAAQDYSNRLKVNSLTAPPQISPKARVKKEGAVYLKPTQKGNEPHLQNTSKRLFGEDRIVKKGKNKNKINFW